MYIYIAVIIIIILSSAIKNKKIQTYIAALLLILIAGLRDTCIGADTVRYISKFTWISEHSFSEVIYGLNAWGGEYGYLLYNKAVSLISTNIYFFLFITSTLIIILVAKFIYLESRIIWISFLLFICLQYFTDTMNLLKQVFAIAILLNSIKYIKQSKFAYFLMFVLIATLFHSTAIVFVFLYFIYKVEINITYLSAVSVFVLFLFLFGEKILLNIISLTQSFVDYKDLFVKGQGYYLLILLLLINIFIFIFGDLNNKENRVYYHMMIIALVLQVLATKMSVFTRVVDYFSISQIIILPNIIYNLKLKNNRIIITIGLCVFAFAFYFWSLQSTSIGIVPYKTWLMK